MIYDEAIAHFEYGISHDIFSEPVTTYAKLAVSALRAAADRENGCEYCNGTEAAYQHTNTTKLSFGTFGKNRTLETEANACPPYSNCCRRGAPVRSAFVINYCPNCGKQLAPKEAPREP